MPRWILVLSAAAIVLCMAGSALLILRTLVPTEQTGGDASGR